MFNTIQEFVDALNQKFDASHIFGASTPGAKFTRITVDLKSGSSAHGSAYCFIDRDGNIYKTASWKAPAKGVRATLATVDMSKVDPYTSWLYR